jgi:hypothetical protein
LGALHAEHLPTHRNYAGTGTSRPLHFGHRPTLHACKGAGTLKQLHGEHVPACVGTSTGTLKQLYAGPFLAQPKTKVSATIAEHLTARRCDNGTSTQRQLHAGHTLRPKVRIEPGRGLLRRIVALLALGWPHIHKALGDYKKHGVPIYVVTLRPLRGSTITLVMGMKHCAEDIYQEASRATRVPEAFFYLTLRSHVIKPDMCNLAALGIHACSVDQMARAMGPGTRCEEPCPAKG